MAAKRCPMCHEVSRANEPRCACGYVFGQDVETALALLHTRRRELQRALAILGVVDVAAMGGGLYLATLGIPAPLFLLVICAVSCSTGPIARRLLITRRSIRLLGPRELPRATVHARRARRGG